MRFIGLILVLVGCVKGNPQETDTSFSEEGGTLAIPGCGYDLTTRFGAEAPKVATNTFGADPKPVQLPHPPIWIGGGTQPSEKVYGQTVPDITPVLKRIAKYADTWVPHSSSTPERNVASR